MLDHQEPRISESSDGYFSEHRKSEFDTRSQLRVSAAAGAEVSFPLYGPYESAGVMAKDLEGDDALDVCNGHDDELRGYHYHVTPGRFPYILGGYAGAVETSNNRGLNRAGWGALVDNTQPGSRSLPVIATVRPGLASRGKTHSIQFELSPENSRRAIPEGNPSWAQIGPFEASKISREGNIVSAEFAIPDDAVLGVFLDCHLEFGSGAYPLVIKRNDVFRVIE